MPPRHGGSPGAIPGSRTNSSQAARQHAAESPKLSSLRAARRQPAIFIWGRGRQVMHLPCKQVDAGAIPADSTNFNCGENEIQASLISSASVGAPPTPLPNLWEVIRLPDCKSGVTKQS